MLKMAQLLTSKTDAVLIGSLGTYLIYPQVLAARPHDVDLFVEGSVIISKKSSQSLRTMVILSIPGRMRLVRILTSAFFRDAFIFVVSRTVCILMLPMR